jgi:hypothetical protein
VSLPAGCGHIRVGPARRCAPHLPCRGNRRRPADEGRSVAGQAHHTGGRGARVNGERRLHLASASRLMLTGNAAEDNRRRTMWRRTFAGSAEPLPPRDRELATLRHRGDVLDDALALEVRSRGGIPANGSPPSASAPRSLSARCRRPGRLGLAFTHSRWSSASCSLLASQGAAARTMHGGHRTIERSLRDGSASGGRHRARSLHLLPERAGRQQHLVRHRRLSRRRLSASRGRRGRMPRR